MTGKSNAWSPKTGGAYTIKYISACKHDGNGIPTATPPFRGLEEISLVQSCCWNTENGLYELRYTYQYLYFRLVETIFDSTVTQTTKSIYTSPTVWLDPENVGVAFGICGYHVFTHFRHHISDRIAVLLQITNFRGNPNLVFTVLIIYICFLF